MIYFEKEFKISFQPYALKMLTLPGDKLNQLVTVSQHFPSFMALFHYTPIQYVILQKSFAYKWDKEEGAEERYPGRSRRESCIQGDKNIQ
jgi:hypothetical protein